MQNITTYNCFISSPSDTKAQRDCCENIFKEINKTIGNIYNFRVEPTLWESDARPGFGSDPQAVINEQLLDKYDLMIVILWCRFGAPTPRANSGTEEEFFDAYKKMREGKTLDILVYFNEESAPISAIDPEQLKKVKEFKQKIGTLGGLYTEFSGTPDFEKKLKQNITDFFIDKHKKK